jgi:5'-methylthioadenosine phosphorylase
MKGLNVLETLTPATPFGKPSSPIVVGEINGRMMAFLARHGIGHIYSPTEVNYRANIYALKALGVQRIVSISACGSLRDDFKPGEIVIPDNLLDFTRERKRTFFEGGIVAHVGSANPYCNQLSGWVSDAVEESGGTVHRGGTLITIEGPRFSTRAESSLFRQWGMSIIGMTASPEAFLAREAEMCYTTMAHVTDYDVWHVSEEEVSVELVIKTLMKNTELAQKAIFALASQSDMADDCECYHALKDAIITRPTAISVDAKQRLDLLISKYIQG